jgi:hypothetical protein
LGSEPAVTLVNWPAANRLIASRYPTVGILDWIARPDDLKAMFELEAWTNDRISTELGLLHVIPRDEWVVGQPMSSVVMAAFCHPRTGGARFSTGERGAWYAARRLDTALAETVFHRTRELAEVGHFDTRVQMRLYQAAIRGSFHDIRSGAPQYRPLYDPDSYVASQRFARDLLDSGSNGIVYNSVRHPGGECVACFRPALMRRTRIASHYEYVWEGTPTPRIRRLPGPT